MRNLSKIILSNTFISFDPSELLIISFSGFGAMAEVSTIVTKIMDIVHSTVPLT